MHRRKGGTALFLNLIFVYIRDQRNVIAVGEHRQGGEIIWDFWDLVFFCRLAFYLRFPVFFASVFGLRVIPDLRNIVCALAMRLGQLWEWKFSWIWFFLRAIWTPFFGGGFWFDSTWGFIIDSSWWRRWWGRLTRWSLSIQSTLHISHQPKCIKLFANVNGRRDCTWWIEALPQRAAVRSPQTRASSRSISFERCLLCRADV